MMRDKAFAVFNNEEKVEKQREIGQTILMTRMIISENDKVRKGGFSHLDRNAIAAWAQKPKEEISCLIDNIAALGHEPHA